MKVGLVLEGGGMRSLYTIGVLDYFLDLDLTFPLCVGVSAGACNGISFASRQKGRAFRANIYYIRDKRYVGLRNFLKTGSIFGIDFLFNEIPNNLDPFDFETFQNSPMEFLTGVTNVKTGLTEYFPKADIDRSFSLLQASAAIPCFSPMVEFHGEKYLDGGASDPIPFKKALSFGCDKAIVILTRHKGYLKSPQKLKAAYRLIFRDYPKMVELLDNRHISYNETLNDLSVAAESGKVLVLAPQDEVKLSRFEKNVNNLQALYLKGYSDAKALEKEILSFIS